MFRIFFQAKKYLFIEGLGCLNDLGWVSGSWPRIQDDSSPHHSVQQGRLQSFGQGGYEPKFFGTPLSIFGAPNFTWGGYHESTNK